MERIEQFKNSLTRAELYRFADEAMREALAAREGQFFLTEVIANEMVDDLIVRRLRLPSYKRWREQFARRRTAQQEPTHWGIGASSPVATLLPRMEPGDHALVIGAGAEPCAYLLAAFDVEVLFLDDDCGYLDRVETRAATESLAGLVTTSTIDWGCRPGAARTGFPLVVIDVASLADREAQVRRELLDALQQHTLPGGVHVLLRSGGALAPEAVLGSYGSWEREGDARGSRTDGWVLVKPLPPAPGEAARTA